jgi:hypothetical protein
MDSETDEREGLPSASGIEQMKLCPGSFNYQKLFPSTSGSDANEGTLRHDLIEQVILGTLAHDEIEDDAQRDCVGRALEILKRVELDIGQKVFQAEQHFENQWLEKRIWFNENEDKLYSAKYDLLRQYDGDVYLLVDWKTLYGDHTEAQNNIQLLAQALAVYQNTEGMKRIFCALVEPFPYPSYSLVEYSTDRLEELKELVSNIISTANSETAEKVVGLKQCKFCNGLAHCEEVATTIQEESLCGEKGLDETSLPWALEIAILAEKWASAVKSRAKKHLSDGDEIEGWKLRSSGNVKSISDANLCAERIMDTNQLKWEELLKASSISMSKLVKVWTEKRNENGANLKRKDAVEELEQILEGVITEKPKAEALSRVK